MTNYKFLSSVLFALTAAPALAAGYDPSWDGNHPSAKSEAWTWMGHLQELTTTPTGATALGPNGVGFIYYYTRNDEGAVGSMDFRSSALTTTVNGNGTAYRTATLYNPQYKNSELRAAAGKLDLSFVAGKVSDRVQNVPLASGDLAKLNATIRLYPGLSIAPGVTPKKTVFQVTEEDGTHFELEFYSIWPVMSPPNGTMTFLGQASTYSFSEPMLVTMGKYNGKPVAGLSFLDRQWAPQYFGQNIMTNIADLIKYAHALNYSHTWSAFHAHNERTNEWSFFHLWHQFHRVDGAADQLVDYSGMLYMRNGVETKLVQASDYDWTPSGFVQFGGREVMLDYTGGRTGFFPSRATYSSPKLGFQGVMTAYPALEALNQPIPFYEGYASGEGTWNGDPVRLQGRLESSRLMFRPQDYQEMLNILQRQESDWQQHDLQSWLSQNLAPIDTSNPVAWIDQQMASMLSMISDMELKMAIFGSILKGEKPKADPAHPGVTIYP